MIYRHQKALTQPFKREISLLDVSDLEFDSKQNDKKEARISHMMIQNPTKVIFSYLIPFGFNRLIEL